MIGKKIRYRGPGEDDEMKIFFVCLFVIGYVIPTFLKLLGAAKVVRLLEKREALILEFNTELLTWKNQEECSV